MAYSMIPSGIIVETIAAIERSTYCPSPVRLRACSAESAVNAIIVPIMKSG